ncbi:hypothetical protein HPB48_010885 [Haemaphysalis longicornis]|uniref:Uncharacterized protein n=1 Tax=Haemaphysalis longicornis TaxID=44386 RepID=A0A9J6G9Q7_HAELO|nr:hypothetical protein HPB48_010885 [Haemaphysalis longicornis]
MGLLLSLPLTATFDTLREPGPDHHPTEEDEDRHAEAVVTGGEAVEVLASVAESPTREAEETLAAPAMQQERQQEVAGDGGGQPPELWLPQVDTDDAVRIWCSLNQPSQLAQGTSSAWMKADEERSTIGSEVTEDEEYEDDEEDEEDEEYDDEETSSSETSSSSPFDSTITSGMLRRWKRIRERYVDNPDIIGDTYVYRVLTYLGHPHWRKMDAPSFPAAGDSPNPSTSLRATMAVRLEDLRQKRLQLKAVQRSLKDCREPVSRAMLEGPRRAVRQLEAEAMNPGSAKEELVAATEDAAAVNQDP